MKPPARWIRFLALGICVVAFVGTTTLVRERRAILAGKWYPETPERIFADVKGFIDPVASHQAPGRLVGAIIPSATWAISGPMSGEILHEIVPGAYDRVIVLTATHTAVFQGCSVAAVQFYRTPIGPIPMDMDALYLLRRHRLITPRSVSYNRSLLRSGARKPIHETEYGIEVVLPMLQARLGTFRLMPFVVGDMDSYDGKPDLERIDDVANALKKHVSPTTLVIVTTGLTHYGREYGYVPFNTDIAANIEKLDRQALQYIARRDVPGFLNYIVKSGNPIDGAIPLAIMMRLFPDTVEGQVLHRFSSADVVPDVKTSVSYASVAFYDTARLPAVAVPSNPAIGVDTNPAPKQDAEPPGQ